MPERRDIGGTYEELDEAWFLEWSEEGEPEAEDGENPLLDNAADEGKDGREGDRCVGGGGALEGDVDTTS